jgi:hypothetical protein
MSRTLACAGSAFVLATLAGAPPAGASDDSSTLTSVMSLFGIGSEEQQEKIVYRERPKLVLPPGGRGLPEPQAHDGARPASWPVDQEVARRRGGETPAPRASLDENANDPSAKRGPTKCLSATSDGRCTVVTDADEPLLGGGGPKTRGAGEPSTRAFLTEPPASFRERVAGGKGVPDAEKSSDWWNPGALIGRVFGN